MEISDGAATGWCARRIRPGRGDGHSARSADGWRARQTVYRTTITDISGRLRAVRALWESEVRYRELVELSPDGIFKYTPRAGIFP